MHIKAGQICHSIASVPILNFNITVSIGGISATDIDFNDAYKAADKALYVSKNQEGISTPLLNNPINDYIIINLDNGYL